MNDGMNEMGLWTTILITLALALGGAGAAVGQKSWLLYQEGTETAGRVLQVHGGSSKRPLVAFDVAGVSHRFESWTAAGESKGDDVTVLYLPTDPAVAAIKAVQHMWILPGGLVGGGVLALIGAIALLVKAVRRQRGAQA